ncbi:MAG: 4Fe-4S dicluster domain-containing protein [Bacteroidales bacterium]|nr:4Fe-4S dicluster domain-containing protein [Bacteroidales bacterium]
MKAFGFNLQKTRTFFIDTRTEPDRTLSRKVPSFRQCMFCGSCAGTCSANSHTPFNILRYNLLFRHGMQEEIADALDACMLCGKCSIVCPRGVNTRAMIMEMRNELQATNDHA